MPPSTRLTWKPRGLGFRATCRFQRLPAVLLSTRKVPSSELRFGSEGLKRGSEDLAM